MNLVGKILVVALMVMSIVFGSMTLAVHATHRNWKLTVDNPNPREPGLKQIIAERDTLIARLQADLSNKALIYDRMLRESEQRLGQMESANSELQKAQLALQTEIGTKSKNLNDAIKQAADSVNVLAKTQAENKIIRDESVEVKMQRDQHYDKYLEQSDKLAQAAGEWSRLSERNKQLLAQCAQYRIVMQDNNLPLNLEVPTVFGLIEETHTLEKMVKINLGSDDGLKKGVVMDVYRFGDTLADTTYLGQIRLSTVGKTEAVGQIISLKGTIQKDDHVATRIE